MMHKKNGKIQPVAEKTETINSGDIPYVIFCLPFSFTNIKKSNTSLNTEFTVSNSINITTIENDKTKGIVMPENIDVDSFVTSQNIVLIASKSSNVKTEKNDNEISIIVPNTTKIIFIRITTDFYSNPKITDAVLLRQSLDFSENSGDGGAECELA